MKQYLVIAGLLCAGTALTQAQTPTGLASDTPVPAMQSAPSADAAKSGALLQSAPVANPSALPSASAAPVSVPLAAPPSVDLKMVTPSAMEVTLSSGQAVAAPAEVRTELVVPVSASDPK